VHCSALDLRKEGVSVKRARRIKNPSTPLVGLGKGHRKREKRKVEKQGQHNAGGVKTPEGGVRNRVVNGKLSPAFLDPANRRAYAKKQKSSGRRVHRKNQENR